MKDKVLIGLLILISFISILFFGSRKMDYNVDEIWTYGLSNNIGSINPDFEYEKPPVLSEEQENVIKEFNESHDDVYLLEVAVL